MSQLTRTALADKLNIFVQPGVPGGTSAAHIKELLGDLIDSYFNNSDDIGAIGLRDYDPTVSYTAGMGCFHGGRVYRATVDTTGTFDSGDWTDVTTSPVFNNVRYVDAVKGNDSTAIAGSTAFKYATADAAIAAAGNGEMIVFSDGIYNIASNCYKPDIHLYMPYSNSRIDINVCTLTAAGNFYITGNGTVKFIEPISPGVAWSGKIFVNCYARQLSVGFLNSVSVTEAYCYCNVSKTTLLSGASYICKNDAGNIVWEDYAGIVTQATAGGGYYLIWPNSQTATTDRRYIMELKGGEFKPDAYGIVSLKQLGYKAKVDLTINGILTVVDGAQPNAILSVLSTSSQDVKVNMRGRVEINGTRIIYTDDGTGSTNMLITDDLEVDHLAGDVLYLLPQGIARIRGHKSSVVSSTTGLANENVGKFILDNCWIDNSISDAVTTAVLLKVASGVTILKNATLITSKLSKAISAAAAKDIKVYADSLIRGTTNNVTNIITGTVINTDNA